MKTPPNAPPWKGLPSAIHIEWVIGSYTRHKDLWSSGAVWAPPWVSSGHALGTAAARVRRGRARSKLTRTREYAGIPYASDPHFAIAALMSWPDCAYLLDMPLQAVRMMAEGDMPQAVLLYPACAVRTFEKTLLSGEQP